MTDLYTLYNPEKACKKRKTFAVGKINYFHWLVGSRAPVGITMGTLTGLTVRPSAGFAKMRLIFRTRGSHCPFIASRSDCRTTMRDFLIIVGIESAGTRYSRSALSVIWIYAGLADPYRWLSLCATNFLYGSSLSKPELHSVLRIITSWNHVIGDQLAIFVIYLI